ncbi:helix-turn-helix transcriptional regulator [Paraflavitalea sp. CAU 1676]|uniref:helix-turn-helix domain-containing protein n=1 Tax=Paraflavitalea sp. CAU 1676 TaxID=3032598 RepID=UPI0023DC9318|nr:helix-turn-helix transcriptional regulator [Paraflavitalea sp. CAU 1676]MDF2189127.1 helix-turn-helix transcriptional regulator [Paraflavitalea sp. CAU 1676]
MQVIYTPAAIFCLISVVLSLLTGVVLVAFSPNVDKKANRLLGASFLAFGITLTVIYLIYTRLILFCPHFYRIGNVCWLLYIPLSYLYVRATAKREYLSWRDLIHLLPMLYYMIDYGPFIFQSAAAKVPLIRADLDNLNLASSFRQGWLLPANVHVPVRTVIAAFYWILQVRILRGIDKKAISPNPVWLRWQYIYTALQLLLFLPALISFIAGQSLVWPTTIPPALGVLLSAVTLYLYPQILYGIKGNQYESTSSHSPPPAPKTRSQLEEGFVKQSTLALERLMEESKPFLNSHYSLKELAEDLNMPSHQASAFINQATGKNFNDYLNHQRIQYCLEFIRTGKADNLNMNGISQQCGFNNRNTFAIAFKKVTGKLPSEYMTGLEGRPMR